MNELQVLHSKSIARHIREYAESLTIRMRAIEHMDDSLLRNVTPKTMLSTFESVDITLDNQKKVLVDMIPSLREGAL